MRDMRECGLPEPPSLCQEISGQEDVSCPTNCPHADGSLPFVVETVRTQSPVGSGEAWQRAQRGEMAWWEDHVVNTHFEERKQVLMAEKMGIPLDGNFRIDLRGRSVLDVGGGATSILLKCVNGGRRVVIDPLKFPDWVIDRYAAAGIGYLMQPAEEMDESGFDEVWIYNVLQHVRDPREVLVRAMQAGKVLRIFEWTDTGTDDLHIHTITAEFIEGVVGVKGHSEVIDNIDGQQASASWGVFECQTSERKVEVQERPSSVVIVSSGGSNILPSPTPMAVHQPGRSGLVFHVPGIPHTVSNSDFLSCFSPDTDIMTEDGWRSLAELVETNADVRVATLNPETDLVEYHYPERWIKNEYEGKMFHQGGTVDLMVTPEHRLWIRTASEKRAGKPFRFVEAKDADQIVQYRTEFPWQDGDEVDTFVLPEHRRGNGGNRPERSFEMDKWLRFMGWYLSEGSVGYVSYDSSTGIRRNAYTISIAQQKEATKVETIRSLLIDMNIDHTYTGRAFIICDVQLAEWLKRFGKSHDKWIPPEYKSLSRRQMSILFEALISGDGWTYPTGSRYVTYSRRLADDVYEIGLKLGYGVCCYDDPDPNKPRHVLTFTNKNVGPLVNQSRDQREWVHYEGEVYCLDVTNHTVYTRRGGKSCWASNCAYTQKVVKLCSMLTDLGHTVYHYGCEGSEVNCTEDVPVVTDAYRQQFYPNRSREHQFTFDIDDEFHHTFRGRVAEEASKRLGERNFLLCAWGYGHKEISDLLGDKAMTVESGIGYTDTFALYRVFESYTWMHWVYGKHGQHDGGWYDAVIPNYFDPKDFRYEDGKEDWLLYIGRIVKRKGVELCSELAQRTGHKLVIAGQGTLRNEVENIDLKGDHIEYVGYADVEKRKDLMSRAKAVLVPTYYIGPFEGVAVEAMMSGTPVITTDWGVFAEHTLHGVTGYRCRTMEQFEWAVKNVGRIRPEACRYWAMQNYSMDRVARMYDAYFAMLSDLWGKGWYETHDDRTELEWLNRYYPAEATVPPRW